MEAQILATYHTHSVFCDGEMTPEDYVLSAIRKGFKAIGISSHAPVSFSTDWTMKPGRLNEYIDTISMLKEKYRGRIQVYTGLETDYYPGGRDYRQYPGLDYTVGSVHFIYHESANRYLSFDGTLEEFQEMNDTLFDGNTRALVEGYYRLLIQMIRLRPPEILGHLDVLKKNNAGSRFFDETETWYRKIVTETLDAIREREIIVEVNTGGISRGYTAEMYPSDWILALMRERNIPVVLSSDAHHPDTIDAFYPEALKKMKDMGYVTQRILMDDRWQDVPL